MKKAKGKIPGFDLRNLDTAVRPQDDFYHYANGGWLKRNSIPPAESRWGSFTILRYRTEKQLRAVVESLLKEKNLKPGSPAQLVGDLYRSAFDMKRRNRLGPEPLKPLLQKIKSTQTTKDLVTCIARLHRIGISVPWGAEVGQDAKNSIRYTLYLYQSGLSLPDRDYYLKDAPEFMRVRTAYIKHLQKMFLLLGYSKQEAKRRTEAVMRIEKNLAKHSMDKVDVRDAEKTYHKKTVSQLQVLAPEVRWGAFFSHSGVPHIPYIIAMQPKFLKAATHMLTTFSLEEWKIYLEWHVLDAVAPLLSEQFVHSNFYFYGRVLSGSKTMKPLWRRALGVVASSLCDALGKIYVEKYFDQAKKHKMDTLVNGLFAVYDARIQALDWMSLSTKRKAIAKLRTMVRKIGYPKKWKSYRGLTIRSDDLMGNVLRSVALERARELRKLRKPVDRHEWFMSPQTVNAYYHPTMNDIVFPAAILQPPFFNFSADDAINYGGIGAVIGHEMTHGFDDQGAKFDKKGNLKTWWSPNDKKRFEKKGRALAKQYNNFTIVDGVSVNGQLTLGENIADLGGLVIGFEAYQRHLKKTGRKELAGFTPEQRFFLGFAQAERELNRPEALKTRTLTDPHSPPVFRINGPLSHFEPFYNAFGVKKGDKLYRPQKERVRIW